jgi:hypothetical protein
MQRLLTEVARVLCTVPPEIASRTEENPLSLWGVMTADVTPRE